MKFVVVLFLLTVSFNIKGQFDNSIFNIYKNIEPTDSLKFFLNIDNHNFIHNDEYFNNLYNGLTYIGYNILPNISFQPLKNLKLRAGWFLTKFSGKTNFYNSAPYFNCQYKFTKNINLIMGNIYGLTEHNLVEPLYSFDKQFYSKPEQGIQFLGNFKNLDSDLWLNWENFILPNDTTQEEFTLASTSKLKFLKKNNKFKINIPIQGMATHKGGQGNYTSNNYLQTYFNSAIGIEMLYFPKSNSENYFGTKSYFIAYKDGSDKAIQYYSKGYGIYTTFITKLKNFDILLGYWNSEHFIAPRGEFLFQSVSNKYRIWWEPKKQLITNKIQFTHKVTDLLKIAVREEIYYDIIRNNFDYSYSLFLIVNPNYFLKKI